jgi:hypothetical protein
LPLALGDRAYTLKSVHVVFPERPTERVYVIERLSADGSSAYIRYCGTGKPLPDDEGWVNVARLMDAASDNRRVIWYTRGRWLPSE